MDNRRRCVRGEAGTLAAINEIAPDIRLTIASPEDNQPIRRTAHDSEFFDRSGRGDVVAPGADGDRRTHLALPIVPIHRGDTVVIRGVDIEPVIDPLGS